MIHCSPEDLAANRQGQLSAQQRARFEGMIKNGRKLWLILTAAWLGFVALAASGAVRTHAVIPTLIGSAVIGALVAIPLLLIGRRISARAWRVFQEDTVEQLTGRLQHYRRGAYGPYCFVAFNGTHMVAPLELIKPYRAELEQVTYRVYYLKRGGNLLSLEPA